MKFKDIPKLISTTGKYNVHISWIYLKKYLNSLIVKDGKLASLDLNPDFQREHVWTKEQQIAYIEFKLAGGHGANEIIFNCAGWHSDYRGPFVLVDGKQRVTTVLDFLDNKIPAYGIFYKDFEDKLHSLYPNFIFFINDLANYKDVLKWYVQLNSGGTPHTQTEIEKVKNMIKTYNPI